MANRQLALGPKHDSSFWQIQPYAFGETHTSLMPRSHDNGVHLSKSDVNGMSSGEFHDQGLNLLNVENHDMGLEQNHAHEDIPSDKGDDENALVCSKLEDELSLYLENEHGFDQDTLEINDLKLQQTDDNNELDFNTVLQSRVISTPEYELRVGQEFPDVKSCRRVLREIAIALRFEIQMVKSDKTRFTAKCASEGCPWRIHASKLHDGTTFTIKTLNNNHTCGGITHLRHQQASVQWVADSIEERLKENPDFKPKEILEEIHRAHGITLSYKQAWRSKERILASVRGSFEEDFRLLPNYCDQIRQTNPESIATVYGNLEENCFERLFISFGASISGFLKGCRFLIGFDRAVLKSKYVGTLLLASSFDGDGALFPIAFGIVDEENEANWMWFLSELHNLLESKTEEIPEFTFLSNRQKGIVEAVETFFPEAFHGFCVQHLAESFSIVCNNNNNLVYLLWEAAYALTDVEFESKILEIEDMSPDSADWIRRISPHLWATAYFKGTRYGQLRSSIADSLNTWIQESETLPIVQMMEYIRRQLMMWFNERREASSQWTSLLVPTAENQISKVVESARSYRVFQSDETEFAVVSHEGIDNVVDIRNRQCSCNGWQMIGIPCSHAVAALLSCRQNVHRFAEACFLVSSYRNMYAETIHPVPDKSLWGDKNQFVINPPKSLRPPVQKKKRRAGVYDESDRCGKRVVHCSRCRQTGHFRTTCVAPI